MSSPQSIHIYGWHAVLAMLSKMPNRVQRIWLQSGMEDHAKKETLQTLAKKAGVGMELVSSKQLVDIAGEVTHQGVIALVSSFPVYQEADLPSLLDMVNEPPFILILDGVQDPHNLGACFRVADAAGVHFVIAPKDKAVGITPAVVKVASGALSHVPFVQVTNLSRTMEALKARGIWLYGAAGDARATVYQTALTGSIGIVMGAEGTGLRRLTRDQCDGLLSIPMRGSVSSLNVSVATGVILFEAVRQRLQG